MQTKNISDSPMKKPFFVFSYVDVDNKWDMLVNLAGVFAHTLWEAQDHVLSLHLEGTALKHIAVMRVVQADVSVLDAAIGQKRTICVTFPNHEQEKKK